MAIKVLIYATIMFVVLLFAKYNPDLVPVILGLLAIGWFIRLVLTGKPE